MNRLVLAALLLATAAPAAAQLVKCVDERGRTHYTDKPETDCRNAKPAAITGAPPAVVPKPAPPPASPRAPQPAAKPAAPAAPKPAPDAKAPMTEHDKRKFAADCKSAQEMLDFLMSPRGAKAENHAARVALVKENMRGCP